MIVDTEKVSREADGSEGNTSASCLVPPLGGKGDRPGVRFEERTGEPTRSPKIISVFSSDTELVG